MTWIDLESSKGLCPMCRQSMLSLHCLCDIELTCLQNSNGKKRNNGLVCVCFVLFFFLSSHQWLSRRCRTNSIYPFVFLSGMQTWIGKVVRTSVSTKHQINAAVAASLINRSTQDCIPLYTSFLQIKASPTRRTIILA